MPICTCGCGQNITLQAIRKHQKGQTIPRLITAAVTAFHGHGRAVSPPRPAKRPRIEHDYFLSSPSQSAGLSSEAHVHPIDDIEQEDMNANIRDNSDSNKNIDDMICRMQAGIWPHPSDPSFDRSDSESENDQEDSGDSEDEAGDDDNHSDGTWEDWQDGTGSSYGLTAVDLLGEEFERNAVANGEFLQLETCPLSN